MLITSTPQDIRRIQNVIVRNVRIYKYVGTTINENNDISQEECSYNEETFLLLRSQPSICTILWI